jgi:SRSO17 transposase
LFTWDRVAEDDTGFLKQGKASFGVARQDDGSAVKFIHCKIVAFAAYRSGDGHAFSDSELDLPKRWTDDDARMKTTHAPLDTKFYKKLYIAISVIRRAIAANVPFASVAADCVHGVRAVETMLRRSAKDHVLDVRSDHRVQSWGKAERASGRG